MVAMKMVWTLISAMADPPPARTCLMLVFTPIDHDVANVRKMLPNAKTQSSVRQKDR